MTLNFYTLGVIYLVYSFLGWVAETVVATIRGGRFANRVRRQARSAFIYGTTGVLLAVSFSDLRTEPVYLFFACMMAATVMEWITAKLLERLHRRKVVGLFRKKKFNLNGYVCLQYSLLWVRWARQVCCGAIMCCCSCARISLSGCCAWQYGSR